MTKPNATCGKKNNTKNNQVDLTSNNVAGALETNIDSVAECEMPLPTEKQSQNLPVSDPVQNFWEICDAACK